MVKFLKKLEKKINLEQSHIMKWKNKVNKVLIIKRGILNLLYQNPNVLKRKKMIKYQIMQNKWNYFIKNKKEPLRKEKKCILEKLNNLAKKHSKLAKISLNIYFY